jgi:deoxyribonuclease-4
VWVWKALQRGVAVGCDIVQIFVKNNMQWFGKPPEPQTLALYAERTGLAKNIVGLRPCRLPDQPRRAPCDNRDKSLKSLVQEIGFATQFGLPFLVMHPGAHLGQGETAG